MSSSKEKLIYLDLGLKINHSDLFVSGLEAKDDHTFRALAENLVPRP